MGSPTPEIEAPPLDPAGESAATDDSVFTEKCLLLVEKFTSRINWRLDRSLLSRNAKWGLVWRGDFNIADLPLPRLINRIMCWQGSDGKIVLEVAVGQAIAPLPPGLPIEPAQR